MVFRLVPSRISFHHCCSQKSKESQTHSQHMNGWYIRAHHWTWANRTTGCIQINIYIANYMYIHVYRMCVCRYCLRYALHAQSQKKKNKNSIYFQPRRSYYINSLLNAQHWRRQSHNFVVVIIFLHRCYLSMLYINNKNSIRFSFGVYRQQRTKNYEWKKRKYDFYSFFFLDFLLGKVGRMENIIVLFLLIFTKASTKHTFLLVNWIEIFSISFDK